jgi:hypothetical protein
VRKHVRENETTLHQKKEVKWGSTSWSWTEYNNQLQKLTLLAGSRGCKAWTAASPPWLLPISFARRLNDFCGVCSNLAHISSVFSALSTLRFFSRFLVRERAWPSRPDSLIKSDLPGHFWTRNRFIDACCAWSQGVYEIFSNTFYRNDISHRFIQKNTLFNNISNHIHTHYHQYFTQLYCCVNYFSGRCCQLWAMSHAALPRFGKWQLRSGLSVNSLCMKRCIYIQFRHL